MAESPLESSGPVEAGDSSEKLIFTVENKDYTGLPYMTPEVRRALIEAIQEAKNKNFSLIFFDADLNELKPINDELGHREGNQAIVSWVDSTRERFKSALNNRYSSEVLFFRPQAGGDELKALLILKLQDYRLVDKAMEEIKKSLSVPVQFRKFNLTAGVGIAVDHTESDVSAGEVLRTLEEKAENMKDDIKLDEIFRKIDETIESGKALDIDSYIKLIQSGWYGRRWTIHVIEVILRQTFAKGLKLTLSTGSSAIGEFMR